MTIKKPVIDISLAQILIATQFPQWKDLSIYPVKTGGWDNRTFHLGDEMLIRMPSAAEYEAQVEKEQYWLPKLSPFLPLQIPTPLAMGKPSEIYPWKWSIYRWIEGDSATLGQIADLQEFAASLAKFLVAFQSIDSKGGPLPGLHSFYRGGALITYDAEVREALAILKGKINIKIATEVWEKALKTTWNREPVWVHGDISPGNVLLQNGHLSAVIDFGQLTVGDPACDLAITWTLLQKENRAIFQKILALDEATWARARGWTLWKAVLVAAGLTNPNNSESIQCWHIIDEVLIDAMN